MKTVPGPKGFQIGQCLILGGISSCSPPKLTGEFTHKAFASAHAADEATTSDALNHVVGGPGDEVAVVDDVFLAFAQLFIVSVMNGRWSCETRQDSHLYG